MESVDVVIPSFKGKELLAANLPPLLEALRGASQAVRVIVVDDGSRDGTPEFLAEQFPGVTVVARPRQGGFAVAMNDGVRVGEGEVILSLNNDIVVTPGFLPPLLEPLADPQVFAVTARLLAPANGGEQNESGHAVFFADQRLKQRRIPHEIMEEAAAPAPVSFAPGTCVAYRRAIYERLGGFDPIFAPFYWEDVDLSYRALKRGYRILYQPRSTVHHARSVTIGRHFAKDYIDAIFWRNLLLLNWKNLTDRDLWVRHLLSLPIECLLALIGGRRHFLLGVAGALSRLRAVREGRRRETAERVVGDRELLRQCREWERALAKAALRGA